MKKRLFDWKEFWFGYPEFWKPVSIILTIILGASFFYYLFLFFKGNPDQNMINLLVSLMALIALMIISFDYRIYKLEKQFKKNQGKK